VLLGDYSEGHIFHSASPYTSSVFRSVGVSSVPFISFTISSATVSYIDVMGLIKDGPMGVGSIVNSCPFIFMLSIRC